MVKKKIDKKNGDKWIARIWIRTADGKRIRPQKSFSKLKDAERWVRMMESDPARDSTSVVARTISEIVEYYKSRSRYTRLASKTKSSYESRIDYFVDYCASKSIVFAHQFTDDHAVDYADKMMASFDYSGADGKITMAQMLLREEMKRQTTLVRRNPFMAVERESRPDKEIRWFSPEELTALKTEMNEYEKDIFLLLLNTGMRTGELSNLTWKQVRFHEMNIHIEPHDSWVPKWKKNRSIPINKTALTILEGFQKDTRDEKYVVRGSRTVPANSFNNNFRELASLVEKKNPHISLCDTSAKTFRATAGSLMLQRGSRIEEVSHFLGHRDIRTTQRHYASLCQENIRNAVSKLDDEEGS